MGKRRLGGYLGALPVGITTDINATKGIFSVDTALDRRLNSLWPTGSGPRNSYAGNATIPVPAGVNSLRFSVQGQNGNGGGGKGGWLQGTIQANNLDTTYYVRQGVGGGQSGRDRPSNGQPNRRGGHYFAILNSASQGTLDADNDLIFMAGGGGGKWWRPGKRAPLLCCRCVFEEAVSLEYLCRSRKPGNEAMAQAMYKV